MQKISILILGGYGAVGRHLSGLLLKETNVDVVIAGRHKDKADTFAALLNRDFSGGRASARYADASDEKSLATAFRKVDLVILAATSPMRVKQIARAALAAKCDYLDIL